MKLRNYRWHLENLKTLFNDQPGCVSRLIRDLYLTQVLRQDCTPRNSHSRNEQFVFARRIITAYLRLLHSTNQWFSTFSLMGL